MDKDAPDVISTRIICQRELVVDGVAFQWWAVGERPALVTVRAKIFGSATEFTRDDVAEFATFLANKLLAQHYARAAAAKAHESKKPPASALKKPGWFEPGGTDYSSTTTLS